MKIKIQMKDPDGVYDAVTDAIKDTLRSIQGISDDEREKLEESRREEANEAIFKWIDYGEYVTIEIDTDNMTATVCER